MSSVAYVDRARMWAETLEDHTARREGLTIAEARPIVAREIGVAPGTLQNLRKRRLKSIAGHIYGALQGAMVRKLEAELKRIEHELHVLAQQGENPASDQMAAALADRHAVRRALGLEKEPVAPLTLIGAAE